MGFPNKTPFTEKELKHDIRYCPMGSSLFAIIAMIFALLGVIGELANATIGLEPLTWLLLAILVMVGSLHFRWTWAVACNLYGMSGKAIKK